MADVHQSGDKWRQLVQAVRDERPGVVLIAGDLLPKDNVILAQTGAVSYIKECAAKIRAAGAELVLICGDDDNQFCVPEIEDIYRIALSIGPK